MGNLKPWIIAFSTVLISCQGQNGGGSSSSSVSNPKAFNSALNAESQSSVAASYRLVKMDGSTPIDGSENKILVCTPKFEYCTQTCIAAYVPSAERWSVFKTDWLSPSGKCVGVAMAYSDGSSIPRYKLWIGTFVFTSGVNGYCSININSPDENGRAYFSFERPANASAFYQHNLFDLSGSATGTVRLLNFNPPGLFTYHDASISNGDLTPQLTNFNCVKESEIGGAFQ
jgi:hypothetical protein